jgi:hypothetical protein
LETYFGEHREMRRRTSEEKALIKDIEHEYQKRLRPFMNKSYRYRKTRHLAMLDALFERLMFSIRKIGKDPILDPSEILQIEPSQVTKKGKNIVYQLKTDLDRKMYFSKGSYYEKDGKDRKIKFEIISVQEGARYRLEAYVYGEPVEIVLKKLRERTPELSTEEEQKVLDWYLNLVNKESCYIDKAVLDMIPNLENLIELERVYFLFIPMNLAT